MFLDLCLTHAASWNHKVWCDSIPHLKGVRCFSFEELKKCTDNFSESNGIGYGGCGKVSSFSIFTGLNSSQTNCERTYVMHRI